MKCNFEWLSAYLDGALPDSKRSELEKHLKTCEACAAKLDELARLEAAAKKIPVPKLSEAYWENFASRVQNKITIRDKQKAAQPWLENLKRFFQPTTGKLALAGSLATILLVATIGQDYWKKETYRPPVFDGQDIKSAVSLNDTLQKPELPEEKERQIDADKRAFAASDRRDEPALEKRTRENKQKGLLAPPASAVASKPAGEAAYRSATKDEKGNEADLVEGRVQNEPAEGAAPMAPGKEVAFSKKLAASPVKIQPREIERRPILNNNKLLTRQVGVREPDSVLLDRDSNIIGYVVDGVIVKSVLDDNKRSIRPSTPENASIATAGEKAEIPNKDAASQGRVSKEDIAKLPIRNVPELLATFFIQRNIVADEQLLNKDLPRNQAESLYIILGNEYLQLYRFSSKKDDRKKAESKLKSFLSKEIADSTRSQLLQLQTDLQTIKKQKKAGVTYNYGKMQAEQWINSIRQVTTEIEKEISEEKNPTDRESLYVLLANYYSYLNHEQLLNNRSLNEQDWNKGIDKIDEFLATDVSEATRKKLLEIRVELKKIKK